MNKKNLWAEDLCPGERIDKALALLEDIGTRSRAHALIEKGLVEINGKTVKSSYILKPQDQIRVSLPLPEPSSLTPLDKTLHIVYEDKDLLVVNKPSGLVVHPGAGHSQDTLVNALIAHTSDLSMKFGEERPGIVHRLDKETSGLLVVAKNDFTHEHLALQFKNRETHRIYEALCIGTLSQAQGTTQSYLARHPFERKKYASLQLKNRQIQRAQEPLPSIGKWAVTHFKKKNSTGLLHLLELKLETGRTHQIRVHLSEIGCPILGDALYGADKKITKSAPQWLKKEAQSFCRFYLHARELGFTHPKSGQSLHFQEPWPKEDGILIQKIFSELSLK